MMIIKLYISIVEIQIKKITTSIIYNKEIKIN